MGQARKNRMVCPATGQPITPPECGSNRISTYACPESCPQNPWSAENYDRQLMIYDRMFKKCVLRLADEHLRTGHPFNLPDVNEEPPMMVFFLTRLFRDRDAGGRTFLERWREQGYQGLTNDERVMLESKANIFPAVIEVQQILDDRRALIVDRLADSRTPLLTVDRKMAARCCRFTTLLGFLYRTPHHHRVQGAVVTLPNIPGMEAEEIVLELIRHHRGPADDPPQRADWMLANFELLIASVSAVANARHEAMLANMDAVTTRRTYALRCPPGAFAGKIESHPDVDMDEPSPSQRDDGYRQCWEWTITDRPGEVGRTLLCAILLHQDGHVRVDTTSARLRDQAKRLFEALLGNDAKFLEEHAEDMAKAVLSAQRRFYDKSLVPPRLLQNPGRIETTQTRLPKEYSGLPKNLLMRRIGEEMLLSFADTPIPVLDGKTPRQAGAIPALRPALISLVKTHVHSVDERNLSDGTQTNANGLIQELGLTEIDFPPPPWRKPLEAD